MRIERHLVKIVGHELHQRFRPLAAVKLELNERQSYLQIAQLQVVGDSLRISPLVTIHFGGGHRQRRQIADRTCKFRLPGFHSVVIDRFAHRLNSRFLPQLDCAVDGAKPESRCLAADK